jgi:hypothetical protein
MGNPITVSTLKVTIPLRPDQIPADLVPAEPLPTGSPVLTVQFQGTSVVVPIQLGGKNARKTLRGPNLMRLRSLISGFRPQKDRAS